MSRHTTETKAIDKNIGRMIKEERLAQGMSRQQLAGKIGVTHQQLHKYEDANNRVSASKLVLLAKELKRPVSFFISTHIDTSINQHNRLTIEVSRAFSKISNPNHQVAVSNLIKSLLNN